MPTSLIAVSGLRKHYGRQEALKGISLSAHAHELVVILGPNGAGKSTLVQLLTGLFVPDGGELSILGTDITRDPIAALRSIGTVFQQPTLDPELTVAGNLKFHAGLHGLDRKTTDARISEALQRFEIAALARERVKTLSGGNRRRVELARALLHRPGILILDEPTVGLDPGSRWALMQLARELCRDEGLLVLWTTHLVDEAEEADRVLVLNEGRIVFDGPPGEALESAGTEKLEDAFFRLTGRRLES